MRPRRKRIEQSASCRAAVVKHEEPVSDDISLDLDDTARSGGANFDYEGL